MFLLCASQKSSTLALQLKLRASSFVYALRIRMLIRIYVLIENDGRRSMLQQLDSHDSMTRYVGAMTFCHKSAPLACNSNHSCFLILI